MNGLDESGFELPCWILGRLLLSKILEPIKG